MSSMQRDEHDEYATGVLMSGDVGTRCKTFCDRCPGNKSITLTTYAPVDVQQQIIIPLAGLGCLSNLLEEGIKNILEPTQEDQVKDLPWTCTKNPTIVVRTKPDRIECVDEILL